MSSRLEFISCRGHHASWPSMSAACVHLACSMGEARAELDALLDWLRQDCKYLAAKFAGTLTSRESSSVIRGIEQVTPYATYRDVNNR